LALDIAILLAALGITTLELVEVSAVALALFADSHRHAVFAYAVLGIIVVLAPTFIVARVIALLPLTIIRVFGGCLLLYFGLRLVRSARRSVLRGRGGKLGGGEEKPEKGILYTSFSVGAIEALEAAIVLVGLLPNNYSSTVIGLAGGVAIVIVSTYVLRNQVRKVKQANMKVFVSALLLSFATLWFSDIFFPNLTDLILIPLFCAFALIVHWIANRPGQKLAVPQPSQEGAQSESEQKQ
jgi:uncharacterized membrane protein